MYRTQEERIATAALAKSRKREVIRQMGMDPDETRKVKRMKDCTRIHRDRVSSADLIAEYQDEQTAAA